MATAAACATPFRHAQDARLDPLARNGAGDEHDAPVVTRDHRAADGRLFDGERRSGRPTSASAHANAIVGSRTRSRTRRSIAASRARANASAVMPLLNAGQLGLRFTRQRRPRAVVEGGARLPHDLGVERRQAIEQRLPRLAAQPAGPGARRVQFRGGAIDHGVELVAKRPVRPRLGQPQHDPLEVRGSDTTAIADCRLLIADCSRRRGD